MDCAAAQHLHRSTLTAPFAHRGRLAVQRCSWPRKVVKRPFVLLGPVPLGTDLQCSVPCLHATTAYSNLGLLHTHAADQVQQGLKPARPAACAQGLSGIAGREAANTGLRGHQQVRSSSHLRPTRACAPCSWYQAARPYSDASCRLLSALAAKLWLELRVIGCSQHVSHSSRLPACTSQPPWQLP